MRAGPTLVMVAGALMAATETRAEQTVLQRVLAMTPRLSGLFVNVAETAVPRVDGVPAGIEGSIETRLRGVRKAGGRSGAASASVPAFAINGATTTAFAAINAGETTIGIDAAFTYGQPDPDDPAGRARDVIPTALAGLGASTAAAGAGVGTDASARALDLVTPGTDRAAPVLVANVAAGLTGVTGSVLTEIRQTSARVGDLAATAGGVVNSGTVTAGLRELRHDLEASITGSD